MIDLPAKGKTFISDHSMAPEPNREHSAAVKIAEDHATLPTRSGLMVSYNCKDAFPYVVAIAESDQMLLLGRGVSVAKGIACFIERQSPALVTKFNVEYQHLKQWRSSCIPRRNARSK